MTHRSAPLIAVLILLTSALTAVMPAADAAHGDVHADAGDSAFVPVGEPATASGYAVGHGPFSYHWTHLGSDDRFADPGAPSTTFDTTGLPEGGHDLTLTVTDAEGNTAVDTVRVFVYHPTERVLLDATDTLLTGIPFLITPADARAHNFTVPPGALRMDLTLDWENGANDLDLYVDDPSGRHSSNSDGATMNHPETLSLANPAPGEWTATVDGFVNTPETYSLNITVLLAPDDPRPRAVPFGPYIYGANESQLLTGEARGAGNATGAWDLDGDGVFDASGLETTAAYAVGGHAPTLKVTNDAGYEARRTTTVTVVENLGVSLHCGGTHQPSSVPAMEVDHLGAGCWGHLGHHTYLPGRDRVLTLGDGEGRVFSVEVQLAPPTEAMAGVDIDANTANGNGDARAHAHVDAPVVLETSMDGITWTLLENVEYEVTTAAVAAGTGGPGLSWTGVPGRQSIHFAFDGDGREFRYLRVRQPLSASQGLSGYLDASTVRLEALDAVKLPASKLKNGTVSLDCQGDITEDFFATHPCWFGGVDRYDSPSAMHTYPLGEARVDTVRGHATVLPWRTDDFWYQRAPTALHNVTVGLYASADGAEWTKLGDFEGAYGAPITINATVPDGADAAFLRLVPERHQLYWSDAPLKHMRGYVVDSALAVSGAFAADA